MHNQHPKPSKATERQHSFSEASPTEKRQITHEELLANIRSYFRKDCEDPFLLSPTRDRGFTNTLRAAEIVGQTLQLFGVAPESLPINISRDDASHRESAFVTLRKRLETMVEVHLASEDEVLLQKQPRQPPIPVSLSDADRMLANQLIAACKLDSTVAVVSTNTHNADMTQHSVKVISKVAELIANDRLLDETLRFLYDQG